MRKNQRRVGGFCCVFPFVTSADQLVIESIWLVTFQLIPAPDYHQPSFSLLSWRAKQVR
jgi:hypothetical protein